MKNYIFPARFTSNKEGEGYHIIFLDLPGCTAKGYSLEEALRNARVALELHLSGFIDDGDEIPEASKPSRTVETKDDFIRFIEANEENIRSILESNFY